MPPGSKLVSLSGETDGSEIPRPTTVWMVLKTLGNSGINPKNHLNTGVKQPGYHPNITPVLPTNYNGC